MVDEPEPESGSQPGRDGVRADGGADDAADRASDGTDAREGDATDAPTGDASRGKDSAGDESTSDESTSDESTGKEADDGGDGPEGDQPDDGVGAVDGSDEDDAGGDGADDTGDSGADDGGGDDADDAGDRETGGVDADDADVDDDADGVDDTDADPDDADDTDADPDDADDGGADLDADAGDDADGSGSGESDFDAAFRPFTDQAGETEETGEATAGHPEAGPTDADDDPGGATDADDVGDAAGDAGDDADDGPGGTTDAEVEAEIAPEVEAELEEYDHEGAVDPYPEGSEEQARGLEEVDDHEAEGAAERPDNMAEATPLERKTGPAEDEEMPLADHIEEMVTRLFVIVAVAGVVSVAVFPFTEELINFLWYSVLPGGDIARPRVYHPLSLLITQIKVASLGGLVIALPVFVYQTYAFMRPGLYPNERRYYLAAVPTSLVLAFVGITFAYFIVLPAVFTYFLYYTDTVASVAFALSQTFNLILVLMGYLAVIFQIPLLIMLAIMMGLATRQWMQARRLYFWGGFLGLAFIINPDPTGLVPFIVGGTMIGLFEGTLLLLRWTGR